MPEVTELPAVNATLNAISALLLVTGYILIRRGQAQEHRLCMLAAFATLLSLALQTRGEGLGKPKSQNSAQLVAE